MINRFKLSIKIYQGDEWNRHLTFTHDNGTPINLSGHAAILEIRPTFRERDLKAGANSSVKPAVLRLSKGEGIELDSQGNVNIKITSAQSYNIPSGNYVYDLELIHGDTVATALYGNVNVIGEVSDTEAPYLEPSSQYKGLPDNGPDGYLLAKNSDEDYDVHWVPPGAGGGTDLTGYATEIYVDKSDADTLAAAKAYHDANSSGGVDLTPYATKQYSDDEDARILKEAKDYTDINSGGGGSVDLTDYAKKDEDNNWTGDNVFAGRFTRFDHGVLITPDLTRPFTHVNVLPNEIDAGADTFFLDVNDNFAISTTIGNRGLLLLSGDSSGHLRTGTTPYYPDSITTKEYVDNEIAANSGGTVDLTDYYTKSEVDGLLAANGLDPNAPPAPPTPTPINLINNVFSGALIPNVNPTPPKAGDLFYKVSNGGTSNGYDFYFAEGFEDLQGNKIDLTPFCSWSDENDHSQGMVPNQTLSLNIVYLDNGNKVTEKVKRYYPVGTTSNSYHDFSNTCEILWIDRNSFSAPGLDMWVELSYIWEEFEPYEIPGGTP